MEGQKAVLWRTPNASSIIAVKPLFWNLYFETCSCCKTLLLSIKELCQSIWTLYVSVCVARACCAHVCDLKNDWQLWLCVKGFPFPQDALTVTLPFSTFVPIFSPENRSPQWQMRPRLWQKGSCALGCREQTQTRIRTSQITSIMPSTSIRDINSKIN